MSDTSASVARGRLQTIFARERDSTCKSSILEGSKAETASTMCEQPSISQDKTDVKPPASGDISVLKSEAEIQAPACLEAPKTEESSKSDQPSTGTDAADTGDQTIAMPVSNSRASDSQLPWLMAAAAIIAAAGTAWWVNGKSETNGGYFGRRTSSQTEISPAISSKTVETRTSEISINPSQDIPTSAQTTSSAPPPESTAQGGQVKETQAAAGTLGDMTHANLQNNSEVVVPGLSMEAKLAGFFEQASNKTGEFDLDKISFDPAKAALSPSSSEQLQNVAKILNAYPKTKVSVSAYVGPSANSTSSLKLSRARLNSVIRELSRVGYKAPVTAQIYKRMPIRSSNRPGEAQGQELRISLTVTKM